MLSTNLPPRSPLLVAFLLLTVVAQAAIPEVLVLDVHPKHGKDMLPVDMSDYLAQEIDGKGKLIPIVWSLGDPMMRGAVQDGLIPSVPANPSQSQVDDVVRKLKIDYVLRVTAFQQEGAIKGSLELFKGGHSIYKLARTSSVLLGGAFDQDASVQSMARTFSEILASDPWRELPSKPLMQTPEPEPGPGPKKPDVNVPTLPSATDDQTLREKVQALVKEGQTGMAISLLRDAQDEKPEDPDRRKMLVEVLLQSDKPEMAANEARRAADMFPSEVAFHMLAARAWLAAGKPDEARSDLNEVVSRIPDDGAARELLGESALWQLNSQAAIDHFNAAIAASPNPEAVLYRGLAKAIAGDTDGAQADFDAAKNLSDNDVTARYGFSMLVCGKATQQIGDELKPLFRAATANPSPDVASGAAYQAKRVAGLIAFLGALPVPKSHESSHARRILALKLLAQAISDLSGYLQTPEDEILTDARLNLGEALKQYAAVEEVYATELKTSSGNAISNP